MDLIADTVFLIDLWREARTPGVAMAFARNNRSRQVGIPWVVAGEFLAGATAAGQDVGLVASFLSRYQVIHSDAAIVSAYAAAYAALRKGSLQIGPNDLWIAAVGLALELPLITRNAVEFRRVTGLRVVDYAAAATADPE